MTATGAGRPAPLPNSAVLIDALSLVAITLLSAMPYVGRVGFYSDDWSLLAGFSARANLPLVQLASEGFPGRPVQALLSALLFKLFGLDPLGYHVFDTAVLAACAALLYLLLIRLRFPGSRAFAATLIFALLPQLSTVRVWFASFQVPLSMALMLASMHWQLSFARRGGAGPLAGAVVAAALSVGAYEIFGPLLAGFALDLVAARWSKAKGKAGLRTIAAAVLVVALIIAAFVYKLLASGRSGAVGDPRRYLQGIHQLFRLDYDWRTDSGLNVIATPATHFWAPVEGWWRGAETLFGGRAGPQITIVALATAVIAFWRLAQRFDGSRDRQLLLLGLATFLLGNATFLVVPAVAFTSTGLDNRVHVAAAIGVAFIFAALLGLLAAAAPHRYRPLAFAASVALISAAALVRIAQIENYWAEAPALQQRVLAAARADLQPVPSNSTIILDGVCPYHGPAVIFEADWDIGGALTLAVGRPLRGDAVSTRMSVTARGLRTSIYKQPSFYPFGPDLYVYNPVKHQLARLDNLAAASSYFQNRRERPCAGYVARGVDV